MKTPLDRIRRGASFLILVSVLAVLGHHYLHPETWLQSVYWYVITVSSVGYAENSLVTPKVQALTVVVIVIGMSAAIYTIGGLIQMMTEGELDRALGVRRMTRGIGRLKDHVIICGFGRIGQILAEDLVQQGQKLLIVDSDPERVNEA